MPLKSSSSLNPGAQEWRPTPPPLVTTTTPPKTTFRAEAAAVQAAFTAVNGTSLQPLLVCTPHFQSSLPLPVNSVPTAAFTPAPPHSHCLSYQVPHQQMAYYSSFVTYHWLASAPCTAPNPVYLYSREPVNFPSNDCFYEAPALEKTSENPTEKKMTRAWIKSPKSPLLGARLRNTRGGRRGLPPQMQRTVVMSDYINSRDERDFMLKCLDQCCRDYSLEYDFFYLPMDFRRRNNLGYAFVNFTNAASALEFKKCFRGFKWGIIYTDNGLISSKKICDITWARIQGKVGLLNRFGGSIFYCDRLDYLPVLLDPPRNGLNPNPPAPLIIGELYYSRRPVLRKI